MRGFYDIDWEPDKIWLLAHTTRQTHLPLLYHNVPSDIIDAFMDGVSNDGLSSLIFGLIGMNVAYFSGQLTYPDVSSIDRCRLPVQRLGTGMF